MPVDPYRNVVKSFDRMTTQVRRIADAMATPVVEDADARQTTGDDAPRQPAYDSVLAYIRSQPTDYLPTTIVERNALVWHAVHAALDAMPEHPAVAELARVRRALDPDDETYIRETVHDQLAMSAREDRVRSVVSLWAPRLLPHSEAHRLLTDVRTALGTIKEH
ncbi:hypothetical protein [Streptomyces sp. 900116325]